MPTRSCLDLTRLRRWRSWRRARDGLGEHNDHDQRLMTSPTRLLAGGRRPGGELSRLEDLLERLDARLDIPLGHLVEGVQVRGEIHVTRGDPRPVLLRIHQPAEEILGRLGVLAVGKHAVRHGHERVVALAGGRRVQAVLVTPISGRSRLAETMMLGVVGARIWLVRKTLLLAGSSHPMHPRCRLALELLDVLHGLLDSLGSSATFLPSLSMPSRRRTRGG